MIFDGFDWDSGNREKCQKHGLALSEIEEAVERGFDVFPDLAHSKAERRMRGIARNLEGRRVLFVFTVRERNGKAFMRLLSARYMHAKEVRYYEKEIAGIAKR